MAYFELSGLGDALHVGPQVALPAFRGVPIIQRGPHGARFAPIPSQAGGGIRFWSETEGRVGGETWTPKTTVVGIMGLGEISDDLKKEWTERVSQLEKLVKDPPESLPLTSIRRMVEKHREELSKIPPGERWPSGSWWWGYASWQELWDKLVDIRAFVGFLEGRTSADALKAKPVVDPYATTARQAVTDPMSLVLEAKRRAEEAVAAAKRAVDEKIAGQTKNLIVAGVVVAGVLILAAGALGAGYGVGGAVPKAVSSAFKKNPRRARRRRNRR